MFRGSADRKEQTSASRGCELSDALIQNCHRRRVQADVSSCFLSCPVQHPQHSMLWCQLPRHRRPLGCVCPHNKSMAAGSHCLPCRRIHCHQSIRSRTHASRRARRYPEEPLHCTLRHWDPVTVVRFSYCSALLADWKLGFPGLDTCCFHG